MGGGKLSLLPFDRRQGIPNALFIKAPLTLTSALWFFSKRLIRNLDCNAFIHGQEFLKLVKKFLMTAVSLFSDRKITVPKK